jgi:predicted transcriptional regulator
MARVRDFMQKVTLVIKKDTSIECACKMLIEKRLSGMPVEDNKGNLVGFLSERDIINAISKGRPLNVKVENIMTKKVFSIEEGTSIEELSKVFMAKPYRYIPVLKNKKVVGIISRKDMVDKMLGHYY